MKEKILHLDNVTFAYPGNTPILEDIELEIYRGDFFVILGPNGSAKTTLLKIMLGLLKPQKGTLKIYKSGIASPHMGYLPQKASFNQGFPATVREVLEMTSKKAALGNNDQYPQINAILEKVELQEKSNSLLGTLSGGQLQRVFLARALLNNPQILFLDEPVNNLDIQAQNELYKLLHNLHQEGLTIITVTHDPDSILNYASRLLYVDKKKITEVTKENWGVV